MIHPALWYLVRTRVRNRVLQWLRKLKTPGGFFGGIVLVFVVIGAFFIGDWGGVTITQRQAIFTTLLGFLLWSGILGGLGQRGLVYAPADLDFLFPGPFARRQLVIYQFAMQYVAAVVMSIVYLLLFGGRFLPHPVWFGLGAFLCQVTAAHLGTAAAELSMLVADAVFRRVRAVTVVLLVVVTITAVSLVVAGIAGWGNIPAQLDRAMSGDVLRVLLFPAVQATELAVVSDWGARLTALGSLLACVVASFLLVVWIPADVVEGSFAASRKLQRRVEDLKRGVVTKGKGGASAPLPRSPWMQGAGAVFWLNWLSLRRQLRAVLGGLFVVVMIFSIFAVRSDDTSRLDGSMLGLLAMVPLWMHLPIGFRLPRDQLAAMRNLPTSRTRIAAALLSVPVLVPFVLQVIGLTLFAAIGVLPPALALLALPAYLAAAATLLTIEAIFSLRKPHANAVNVLQAMAQLITQMLALVPGFATLLGVRMATGDMHAGLAAGALVQGLIAGVLLTTLGRQFQERELPGLS